MKRIQTWAMFVALVVVAQPARAQERSAIDAEIAKLGPDVRVAIDVCRLPGPGVEAASYRKDADAVLPTASSIKTAIMIELFAKYAGKLDEPVPGLDTILKDDHPAVAHFTPEQREEIREGLSGSTVRRIGRVLMGPEKAPNRVYNAASNVAIALLGGPEETTRLIHARDPEFSEIMVRRYMLADRKVRGDNESTPTALVAVLRRLADRSMAGLDAETIDACLDAISNYGTPDGGRRFVKNGGLSSPPITRVIAGWYERPNAPPIAYVAMLALDESVSDSPDEAGKRLSQAGERLVRLAIDSLENP